MGKVLVGFVLPLLLLIAGLLNWSLISFINLVASLIFRFTFPKTGFEYGGRVLSLWFVFIYSAVVITSQVIFLILSAVLDRRWTVPEAWWIEFIGLMNIESWRSPTVIYFLVVQLLAGLVAFIEINRSRFGFIGSQDSCWDHFSLLVEQIGYRFRLVCCLLLPAVQLATGISNPSWLSLPFFICSCVGLVDWSLTSNFLGLFRWWKLLWVYGGFNIGLLYVYQLPVGLAQSFQGISDSIGLYKACVSSDWQEICSGISLMVFYYMLSFVKHDLEDMEFMMSMREGSLTEQLLPTRNSFFVRQLRSGVRHTNILLRGSIFRFFSINWFTYGFPVSLFALSYWSFSFASICAFALLAYVGYVLYAFPSLIWLHRLNGLLLVFILLWAISTYIFNVAFAYVNWKLGKDMEIWEMVGLWHYPIPGFFLLAQFCLGVLVALGNLVNNSVFFFLSNEERQLSDENRIEEVKEDAKVLIVATIAWGLRKCARPIMLLLIFLIAAKPGLVHAVYIIFFFAYLLSHQINKRMRQCLILLCEAHFAALYILQLSLVSRKLEQKGSISLKVLQELGLVQSDSTWEFLEIALLACLCAIHNHGFEMLFSFSKTVQRTPYPPIGFGILKAGLNKSVLLSVYTTFNFRDHRDNSSHERRVALYLSAIGEKFLSIYRSFGTYIAFLTILFAVYLVRPNYTSFGYIFLLLIWIIGRQLVERTKQRLWFPLKAYAIVVFIFIYILSIFPTLETWMSKKVNLYVCFGYNTEASLLENLWESLAIVIVMQLYSYERRQSKRMNLEDADPLQFGILGFIKRFLIWHSQKILFVALFYASLSPISAFGFLYILGLILSSALPKASRIPSKSFLIYTGFLISVEYLFQMWGTLAQMFPGQKHHGLSLFLGLQVYAPSLKGLEAGLRPKVLVIAACILEYNVFHWLERMSGSLPNAGRSEEPCPLFVSEEDVSTVVLTPSRDSEASSESSELLRQKIRSNSRSSFRQANDQASQDLSPGRGFHENGSNRKFSFGYIWGSIKESHKWNKKRVVSLRQERFEMQKTMLKVYLKFWIENMFNLFGLEINMLALLLASFALLNAVSLFYIASLATCVLLARPIIQRLWPVFVTLFAIILLAEYFAMWSTMMPFSQHVPTPTDTRCHDCWKNSSVYFQYCEMCWLGVVVDDPRMLISYYMVFMLACFKLRADRAPSYSWLSTYQQMVSQHKNASVWRDISFETKSMWTILDYLRVYCYCHLLDLVLTLILITGTLEYDILHLGYLGFALIFFRMRLSILKKKNKIFKFLRVYNFAVIVLSLAYQSPFVGDFTAGKCETVDYIYEVIGFYKYDYGFRITSRSALVEIIIFVLVSCQSYMFSSSEFDYVFRYLEAEQIGAIVREQEKKATWKTEQLQHIRESEEKKRQRNLQVEKMKAEMLNLQIQLHGMNSPTAGADSSPAKEGLRRRKNASLNSQETGNAEKQDGDTNADLVFPSHLYESPRSFRAENPFAVEFTKPQMYASFSEITEVRDDASYTAGNDSDEVKKGKVQSKENHLASAVQLIGDGVSQVQSIGNQAVSSLANFLNISPEDSDSNEPPSLQDGRSTDERSTNDKQTHLSSSSSVLSDKSRTSGFASWQIGRIIRHIWSQMRSNNDIVCYCCFILVFLWNFSLLSMVYLAALFLYALCVNTGPSYIFWVIMLIYTEIYILLQYLYQIIIQHCGFNIQSDLLLELGFPTKKITSAFVISLLPLFLLYLFTLIQSSITAKDSEWISVGFGNGKGGLLNREQVQIGSCWSENSKKCFQLIKQAVISVVNNCCRYWKSLTQEAESPPHFIQLSMDVKAWPEDGIQPERIESGINRLLQLVHDENCKNEMLNPCPCASKVQIRSIEKSSENPGVALAVFEVVYVSSLTDCKPAAQINSLTPASDIAKEILRAQEKELNFKVGFPYCIISVIGGGRREIDLYAYIFGADLTVFFLVAIFYQLVIKNKSEILEYYQLEDQFPKEYVFMLMIIFFLIVVDRVIYLCSFATGKVIFYIFSIFLFTYAVTLYAWNMDTSRKSTAGLAIRAIYLTKAVSLVLQAMQIRYGVPHQSTLYRQFLTSEVSRVNYLGYRLYRALPFLYELRCVLDWSCTATSLTMYDWLKLEDINASLYLVKCDNVLNRASHKQGEKQTKMTKLCNGICLFFILICVIWTPMLMYSSGNPTNIANPVNDASFQFEIKTNGGRLILYQTTLCEIIPWDKVQSNDVDPQNYLDSYNANDIQLICCQADASTLWLVPAVVQKQFIQSLYGKMEMKISWIVTRDRPKGKENVKYEKSVDPSNLPDPSEVERVLNGSSASSSFRIYNIYPRNFRVTGSGEVRPVDQVSLVNADLVLHRETHDWWSFQDINPPDADACGGLSGPMAVVVSEESPQGFLGETLSKFSIWGLYITFVLAVGRFIRMQCSDLRMRIPFENLPSCDRLIAICEDIYAARAEGELGVEEVLYWTLVKIYRSPHMLLEYTKPD
ncbi:piezo-type mechanosensitive ion channel homolog isoform X1 [Salvia hispanica]|uniref:piezo-type mechanosensitive ion channel homolog isoform X1 n=1 Tax=Salvia hispanica TaxID=49212 RepID=UPI00200918F2|nr:piezo-type mechanosensitive ion channel homolog isoform X1 [Salvia hispanica]